MGSPVIQCAAKKFESYISPAEWAKAIQYHVKALHKFLGECESGPEREENEAKREAAAPNEAANRAEYEKQEEELRTQS
jgi:hypothetical protein